MLIRDFAVQLLPRLVHVDSVFNEPNINQSFVPSTAGLANDSP